MSLANAGGYYCKAANRYGSAAVRVHLHVHGLYLSLLLFFSFLCLLTILTLFSCTEVEASQG